MLDGSLPAAISQKMQSTIGLSPTCGARAGGSAACQTGESSLGALERDSIDPALARLAHGDGSGARPTVADPSAVDRGDWQDSPDARADCHLVGRVDLVELD